MRRKICLLHLKCTEGYICWVQDEQKDTSITFEMPRKIHLLNLKCTEEEFCQVCNAQKDPSIKFEMHRRKCLLNLKCTDRYTYQVWNAQKDTSAKYEVHRRIHLFHTQVMQPSASSSPQSCTCTGGVCRQAEIDHMFKAHVLSLFDSFTSEWCLGRWCVTGS